MFSGNNTEKSGIFIKKKLFLLGRFKLLRVRNDAKLIREDLFPPGMTLWLLQNVQKYNFSVNVFIFSKLLPKIMQNH